MRRQPAADLGWPPLAHLADHRRRRLRRRQSRRRARRARTPTGSSSPRQPPPPRLASSTCRASSRPGSRFVEGDVRDRDALDAIEPIDALVECSAEPSALVGMSGDTSYPFETNLVGAYNCLELARRDAAQFVFLSTSRVYPYTTLVAARARARRRRGSSSPPSSAVAGISAAGVAETFPLDGPADALRRDQARRRAADHRVRGELRDRDGRRPLRRDRRAVADGQGRPGRLHLLAARATTSGGR